MAGMRICEPLWTQASPNLGINNGDCGPCSNMHCVQCVVQVEGNVAVGLWVVGFGLECGCVSMGGCTAQLGDSTEMVTVGTT